MRILAPNSNAPKKSSYNKKDGYQQKQDELFNALDFIGYSERAGVPMLFPCSECMHVTERMVCVCVSTCRTSAQALLIG